MISISLFYCCKNVFAHTTHTNIWMIGKNLVKLFLQEKYFYSHLNMEDITDADYTHTKRVSKDSKIRSLGDYHNLYIQTDTLLLADVFVNFQNVCLVIYAFDPAHFVSQPGLAWQAVLKKAKVKLDLLTDTDMLSIVEKSIRGLTVYGYAKANNKYMRNFDKNKESSYQKYWDVNNLYGWAISLKLPVNDFKLGWRFFWIW